MSQPTEEQMKFLEKKRDHIKSITEKMTLEILAEMLNDNLPYLDVHYVHQRALQVLDETIKKVLFQNEKVRAARKAVLKTAIEEFKKKKVVAEFKKPKDSTDVRDRNCERVVQIVVDKVINEEVLFSNDSYLNDVIDNDEELLMYLLSKDYIDSIYDDLTVNLREHERRAFKYLWGDKEREEVTMSDLDNVLKESKKEQDKKPYKIDKE